MLDLKRLLLARAMGGSGGSGGSGGAVYGTITINKEYSTAPSSISLGNDYTLAIEHGKGNDVHGLIYLVQANPSGSTSTYHQFVRAVLPDCFICYVGDGTKTSLVAPKYRKSDALFPLTFQYDNYAVLNAVSSGVSSAVIPNGATIHWIVW